MNKFVIIMVLYVIIGILVTIATFDEIYTESKLESRKLQIDNSKFLFVFACIGLIILWPIKLMENLKK